jgi:hypothetical protein
MRALLVLSLAGCLAEPDPPATCVAAHAIAELDGSIDDISPWLSEDRRWMLFNRYDGVASIVYEARRGSLADPFGTPVAITDGSHQDFDAIGSADGKTVWYEEGDGGGGGPMLEVQRRPDGTFGPAIQAFPELAPLLHPRFTPDQRTVVFGRGNALWMGTRSGASDAFAIHQLQGIAQGYSPAITADGATLYYQRSTDNADFQLATATRSADDFAGTNALTIPGETGAGYPSVQADGKTVVTSVSNGTTLDIWIYCE